MWALWLVGVLSVVAVSLAVAGLVIAVQNSSSDALVVPTVTVTSTPGVSVSTLLTADDAGQIKPSNITIQDDVLAGVNDVLLKNASLEAALADLRAEQEDLRASVGTNVGDRDLVFTGSTLGTGAYTVEAALQALASALDNIEAPTFDRVYLQPFDNSQTDLDTNEDVLLDRVVVNQGFTVVPGVGVTLVGGCTYWIRFSMQVKGQSGFINVQLVEHPSNNPVDVNGVNFNVAPNTVNSTANSVSVNNSVLFYTPPADVTIKLRCIGGANNWEVARAGIALLVLRLG